MTACCRGKGSEESLTPHPTLSKTFQVSESYGLPSERSEECFEPGPGPTLSKTSSKGSLLFSGSNTKLEYVEGLEKEYETLQAAFFALTSHFAKIQFRLRQVMLSNPNERDRLLMELASMAFDGVEEFGKENMPAVSRDLICLGNIRRRQADLINRLRCQMGYFCNNNNIPEDAEADEEDEQDKEEKNRNS